MSVLFGESKKALYALVYVLARQMEWDTNDPVLWDDGDEVLW